MGKPKTALEIMREEAKAVLNQIKNKTPDLEAFYAKVTNDYQDDHSVGAQELKALEVPWALPYERISGPDHPIKEVVNYQKKFDELVTIFEPFGFVRRDMTEKEILMEALTKSQHQNREEWSKTDAIVKLAHTGLALEIGSHDFETMVNDITHYIYQVEKVDKDTHSKLKDSFGLLVGNFRGWLELKHSGYQSSEAITGKQIFDYVNNRYGRYLTNNKITFKATDEFLKMKLHANKAIIYSAFMNLVGNSYYWVSQGGEDKKEILLSAKRASDLPHCNATLYVSDTGPGVPEEKQGRLFTPFFTQRAHGGRGIGLVMIKRNLEMKSAKLFYSNDDKPLSGANFGIGLQVYEEE